ncbi:tripartite motif-containing protein 16-like [Leptodactylus fuscus]
MAERFQSTQPEANSRVFCTYCIHTSVPAMKFCLHCEAYLCSDHLRVHNKSPEHILSELSTALKTTRCTVHKKILEYYCSQDSTLICGSYILEGEHRGHQVESLDKALRRRGANSSNFCHNWNQRDQRCNVTKEISTILGDIRRQLEDLEKKVLTEVSRQEENALLTISDLIQQLEIKKIEISKKIRHIEAQCHMADPVMVLQEQVSCQSEFSDQVNSPIREDGEIQEVDNLCVDLISNTLHILFDTIRHVSRDIYITDPADITLNVDTSGDYITISDNLKVATYSESKNHLPKAPERFECNQILSRQSFSSGVHYWDVEGSGSGMWRVGVCYPSIARDGVIGSNDKSWAVEYFIGEYSALHDSEEVSISKETSHHRLRIRLDYEAGLVSFYELGNPIKHLHTFSTIFTEPLYAVFWVGWDTFIKDSWLKIEEGGK